MDVRYERVAEADLLGLLAAERSLGHPDLEGFTKLLRLRIAAIGLFPHSGRSLRRTGVREWYLHGTPYVVLYLPHASGVDILRVLDARNVADAAMAAP